MMIPAVKVIGQEGHAAYPELARNPLPYAVYLMDYLCEYFPTIEPIAFATGNSSLNVIPRSCIMRFMMPKDLESTFELILNFFEDPDFILEITN